MTTVGSTLFHLTRETKFFNLDNVFATSLLITTLWGFSLAVRHGKHNAQLTLLHAWPQKKGRICDSHTVFGAFSPVCAVHARVVTSFCQSEFYRRPGIWWYVAVIGLGGPFAVFCIVRCGMPGLVCRHPSGHGLCRKSNPEYDFFHMLWHLSSGLGGTIVWRQVAVAGVIRLGVILTHT